jgi:hypothetical protein
MTMKITVSRNFQRWSLGARTLPGGFLGVNRPYWELANEAFYDKTQEYVHVITGRLKASGVEEVHLEGARVVATVTYGGPEVPYAQYEIDRGGDHDFLGRAWEASQGMFEAIFGQTWNRAVTAWDKA